MYTKHESWIIFNRDTLVAAGLLYFSVDALYIKCAIVVLKITVGAITTTSTTASHCCLAMIPGDRWRHILSLTHIRTQTCTHIHTESVPSVAYVFTRTLSRSARVRRVHVGCHSISTIVIGLIRKYYRC